ncbi:DnaB-like helicase C-terminal domain-containing protein [Mycoplasma buteonis]|uniref:DnaB-like helicase C-terminal domain-containing protein n=1 Tax=Mycoplasma buteonis TaxID=171280 RepID=UPI00055F1A02|nr:DnaB-like helicase C-terminal domain-containing protein [Mycoplasma buteonis]
MEITERIRTLESILKEWEDIEDINAGSLTNTGFLPIDYGLFGFRRSQLNILAGRPGTGKTTLALNIMHNVSKRLQPNEYILFISLEQDDYSILEKFIAMNGLYSLNNFKGIRNYKRDLLSDIHSIANRVSKLQVLTSTDPSFRIEYLEEIINKLERQGIKIVAVFLDHLQITETKQVNLLKYEKLTKITRTLKTAALRLNIPIIALSQLSRESVKQASNKTEQAAPSLTHLRDSGSIEQDADTVLYLCDAPQEAQPTNKHIKTIELHVLKNRNGRCGYSNLNFVPEFALMEDEGANLRIRKHILNAQSMETIYKDVIRSYNEAERLQELRRQNEEIKNIVKQEAERKAKENNEVK